MRSGVMRSLAAALAVSAIGATTASATPIVTVTPDAGSVALGDKVFTLSVAPGGVVYDTIALDPNVIAGGGVLKGADGVGLDADGTTLIGLPAATSSFVEASVLGTVGGQDIGLFVQQFPSDSDAAFGLISSPGSTVISDANVLPSLEVASVRFTTGSNNNFGTYTMAFLRAGEVVATATGEFGLRAPVPEPATIGLGVAALAVLGVRRRGR